MTDDDRNTPAGAAPPRKRPDVTYPGHRWGVLADDSWMELVPISQAYVEAAKAAWLRAGGSEEAFSTLFPKYVSREKPRG